MRISDWSSDVCSSDLVRVLRLGGVAEQLCERRHLEPGAVGAAEREPVDGLVLERVFRVGRAAEAVVAVVAAGDGHLQRIEDRHVEFDECGLDVTADLGQVVLRVARRTDHPCRYWERAEWGEGCDSTGMYRLGATP